MPRLHAICRYYWRWFDVHFLGGWDGDQVVLVTRAELYQLRAQIERVMEGVDNSRNAPRHLKALTRLHLKTALGHIERMTGPVAEGDDDADQAA